MGMSFIESDVGSMSLQPGGIFPSFSQDLEPCVAGKMVVQGVGKIEAINRVQISQEKAPSPVAIECGENISVAGWCVDGKGKRASELVFLSLTDEVGTTRYVRANRYERLDVVNKFSSTALSRAGVGALLPSDQLQPGSYRIGIVQVFHDSVALLGNAGLIEILPAEEKEAIALI
jgi:hypothetical protein